MVVSKDVVDSFRVAGKGNFVPRNHARRENAPSRFEVRRRRDREARRPASRRAGAASAPLRRGLRVTYRRLGVKAGRPAARTHGEKRPIALRLRALVNSAGASRYAPLLPAAFSIRAKLCDQLVFELFDFVDFAPENAYQRPSALPSRISAIARPPTAISRSRRVRAKAYACNWRFGEPRKELRLAVPVATSASRRPAKEMAE